jgi:hypothetical protein
MAAAIIAGTPGVGRTKTCREKQIAAVPVLTGLLLNDECVCSQIAVDGLILCLRNKDLSLKEVKSSRSPIAPIGRRLLDRRCNLEIAYIIVVCAGDIAVPTSTITRLTWIEEWVFYLEYAYGRTTMRGLNKKILGGCVQNPFAKF